MPIQSYGTVNGYQTVKEYINVYENQYKIVKKSIYERKYHLENTINGISSKYKYIYLLMIEWKYIWLSKILAKYSRKSIVIPNEWSNIIMSK